MAAPLKATLPPDCHLSAGYTIRINALDPLSGAQVTGVLLTDISFFVSDVGSPTPGADDTPMPLLVPLDDNA